MNRKRVSQTRQGKIDKIIKNLKLGMDLYGVDTVERRTAFYLWAIERVESVINAVMVEAKTKIPAKTQREISQKVTYASIIIMRDGDEETRANMYKEILESFLEILELIKEFV